MYAFRSATLKSTVRRMALFRWPNQPSTRFFHLELVLLCYKLRMSMGIALRGGIVKLG